MAVPMPMPGMTGAQLADAIEQTYPDLPVLIITGYAELPADASRRLRLDKPFRQAELAMMVHRIRHDSALRRLVPIGTDSHP